MKTIVFMGIILFFSLGGCAVWPVMTETDEYRPVDLGKVDQVFYWNAPHPIHLSNDFGESFRQVRNNQILNPLAGENLDLVKGLNGNAGVKAMGRYQNMFKKPPYASKSGEGATQK